MTQQTHDLKSDLAIEALQLSGLLRLRVRGHSMLPSLWPGDFVTIQAQPFDSIHLGDIILYLRNSRFVVHRVRYKAETVIVVGDCLRMPDPPLAASEVLGRVISVRRYGAELPAPHLTVFRRVWSYLLRRCEFLQRVALWIHAKNVRRSEGLADIRPEFSIP